MQEFNRKTELLAPAGSLESAKAAVHAGADAIYMGGPYFSARAFAESSAAGSSDGNSAAKRPATGCSVAAGSAAGCSAGKDTASEKPAEDMLLSAIEYCHLRGVKVYMTLNTLLKEAELTSLYAYLKPYADAGLDAVIVQDFGVLRFVREHFPRLPIHASTQMTVTGARYARMLQALGVSRVVAARELSLSEIRQIYEETGMELEVFAHGALCYAYSGQCLMSSVIGGRSGNRGRCAGPCRLAYEVYDETGRRVNQKGQTDVLSMKDLNTLRRLPEMIEAGVFSFKIEGRMKPPLYVAAVTSVYRKYLDLAEKLLFENAAKEAAEEKAVPGSAPVKRETYRVYAEDERLLLEAFDRGGVTDGYLDGRNGGDMIAAFGKPKRRIPDEALLGRIRRTYLEQDRLLPVSMSAVFHIGEPPRIKLSLCERGREILAEAAGDAPVEAASKRPVMRDELLEKLTRFGGTDFRLIQTKLDADENLFIPMRTVNELRRQAADELKRRILAGDNRE